MEITRNFCVVGIDSVSISGSAFLRFAPRGGAAACGAL